jgi:hypothetical protein
VLLTIILGLLYRKHRINEEIMRKNEELEKNISQLKSELLNKEDREKCSEEGFECKQAEFRSNKRNGGRLDNRHYRSESNDGFYLKSRGRA